MSLLDAFQQQLDPSQVQQISQEIGATPQQTQSAIQAALPMMVAGMASTAQQPGGAGALQGAMSAFGGGGGGGLAGALGGALGGSGGLGGMLGGALGGGGGAGGLGGILGSVLGQHHDAVQNGVTQASGLSGDQTRKLLMVLAPLVLAFLARRHGGQPDAGQLQRDAKEAHEHAEKNHPQVGGILGQILKHVT